MSVSFTHTNYQSRAGWYAADTSWIVSSYLRQTLHHPISSYLQTAALGIVGEFWWVCFRIFLHSPIHLFPFHFLLPCTERCLRHKTIYIHTGESQCISGNVDLLKDASGTHELLSEVVWWQFGLVVTALVTSIKLLRARWVLRSVIICGYTLSSAFSMTHLFSLSCPAEGIYASVWCLSHCPILHILKMTDHGAAPQHAANIQTDSTSGQLVKS